jgi:hypothetical protein
MEHPDEKTLAWLPNVRMMFKSRPDRDAQFDLVVRSLIEGLHMRLLLARGTAHAQTASTVQTSAVQTSAAPRSASRKASKRGKG